MQLGQGFNEIIVAPATPAGSSAVAVLRLSGPGCHKIARRLFTPYKARELQPWKMHLGNIRDPEDGRLLDQVLMVLMPGPHTYTGEELAEIHCHGNPRIIEAIMVAAIKLGARIARPGEFSERAFLQGKMDLLQVEALSQLLANEVQADQPRFLQEVEGQLGKILNVFIDQLLEIQAYLQASLDYPDDVNVPDKEKITGLLAELRQKGLDLLTQQQAQSRLARGVRVVLIGAPNAGKSTLINTLVKNDRLLVSAVAGTTRDFVEVPFVVAGYRLFLVDTAGLGESRDALDAASQERSLQQLQKADIVLYLQDGTAPEQDELIRRVPEGVPVIRLATKADLPGFQTVAGAIALSAHSGTGIAELQEKLSAIVTQMAPSHTADGVLTSTRQTFLVQKVVEECELAQNALSLPDWPLFVSDELSRLEKLLSELTGREVSEEVLSEIFSHFCLGK